MAMPTPEVAFYTADMVRAIIDESRPSPRYETVYGELLVTPSPGVSHQIVVARLFQELYTYCRRERAGHAFLSPADVSWGRRDVLVQPDIFVVDLAEARALDWQGITRLLLAVEVLSPSSHRADRFTKRRLYQDMRTPHYWLVDIDQQAVEVWEPDDILPTVIHGELPWTLEGATQALTIDLEELFAPL